jgi:PhnB protein
MATLNSYLHFDGKCQEAFDFYKSVFGGEFAMVMRYSDVPAGVPTSPDSADRIMHVSLPIGKTSILMGSDAPSSKEAGPVGDNFSVSVTVDSKAEADQIYQKLIGGGTAIMPIGDTFWGSYFGMLKDKFGVNWMVSFDAPRP